MKQTSLFEINELNNAIEDGNEKAVCDALKEKYPTLRFKSGSHDGRIYIYATNLPEECSIQFKVEHWENAYLLQSQIDIYSIYVNSLRIFTFDLLCSVIDFALENMNSLAPKKSILKNGSADDMFGALGMFKNKENETLIIYTIKRDSGMSDYMPIVTFNKKIHEYEVCIMGSYYDYINLDLHKAITKKLEELGWLE